MAYFPKDATVPVGFQRSSAFPRLVTDEAGRIFDRFADIKKVGRRKIFKLGGIGKAVGDIDEAIRELRKSRIEAVTKKFS